jgi:molecular chaperone HtpG
VRSTHGSRIRAWIEDYELDDDGASHKVRRTIGGLLAQLNSTVRRDLALVCESHTKDDIDDIKKI